MFYYGEIRGRPFPKKAGFSLWGCFHGAFQAHSKRNCDSINQRKIENMKKLNKGTFYCGPIIGPFDTNGTRQQTQEKK